MSDVERYVITVQFEAQSLADINELSNQLTRDGFTLTITDDEGKIHALEPGNFGPIGTLDEQVVASLAKGQGRVALGREPDVVVARWENGQPQQP